MRTFILAILAAFIAIPVPVKADSRVDPAGFGQIRVGMTPAQAATALGKPLRTDARHPGGKSCYYISSLNGPEGLLFMVENGTVARLDIERPGMLTEAGAQIGNSEADLRRLFGASLVWMPHKYIERGHYAEFSRDKTHFIIFETDRGKVTLIRAGRLPAVRYVEGCL